MSCTVSEISALTVNLTTIVATILYKQNFARNERSRKRTTKKYTQVQEQCEKNHILVLACHRI